MASTTCPPLATQADAPEQTPSAQIAQYAEAMLPLIKELECTLVLEPGRFLVAPAGGLLTRVLSEKRNGAKRFVITDAAMNDLIRPALYQAHHEILPVDGAPARVLAGEFSDPQAALADVVGPVCESGDFFAQDRALGPQQAGDLLLLAGCGGVRHEPEFELQHAGPAGGDPGGRR